MRETFGSGLWRIVDNEMDRERAARDAILQCAHRDGLRKLHTLWPDFYIIFSHVNLGVLRCRRFSTESLASNLSRSVEKIRDR